MTHAEMNEVYELYALGALEIEAASEIDQHLADGCAYCTEQVGEAVYASAMLSSLAEPLSPPTEVRTRLLAGLRTQTVPVVLPSRKPRWSVAIPALGAACLALLAFSLWLGVETGQLRTDLNKVIGERNQLQSALEILSRSQTRTVQFGTSDAVAHGRIFVNKGGGFVVVASDLPPIASDQTFELWLVPPKGAPRPAGLARAGASGGFVHVSQTPVDPTQIAAVAVSVEPRGGSNAPTTKPFLIVPLG